MPNLGSAPVGMFVRRRTSISQHFGYYRRHAPKEFSRYNVAAGTILGICAYVHLAAICADCRMDSCMQCDTMHLAPNILLCARAPSCAKKVSTKLSRRSPCYNAIGSTSIESKANNDRSAPREIPLGRCLQSPQEGLQHSRCDARILPGSKPLTPLLRPRPETPCCHIARLSRLHTCSNRNDIND